MSLSEPRSLLGPIAELIHPEGELWSRISRVLQLDADVYGEIAGDLGATSQAFAVVIATSVVVGIGQGLAGIFLGMAWTLVLWLLVAGLIWSAAAVLVGERSHYAPLLRCLGFTYVWFALLLLYELPWIGGLFLAAALALNTASSVLALRKILELSTGLALGLYSVAIGAPLLLLWALF